MPLFWRSILSAAVGALIAAHAAQAADTLKVGVTPGPYVEIHEFVNKLFKEKEGIDVKITEFPDYTLPNIALSHGDIDLNNFQHKPYLDNQIKVRGFELVPVEKSVIVPMGLYSHKIKALSELKDGASVTIPNDPSNGARGLLLLQKAGLIKVDPKTGISPTVTDVIENPKKLKIKEIDAAQLPRSLDDVDFSAVTLNFAIAAGLNPKEALLLEGADSPWALWFVAQKGHENDPKIVKYVAAYRSPEVKAFILERFKGAVIPAW